jgi:hypothetical protein
VKRTDESRDFVNVLMNSESILRKTIFVNILMDLETFVNVLMNSENFENS